MARKTANPLPLLSDQLRSVILARGLTGCALAELAGVDRGQIYRLLSGERSPSLDTVDRLAAALGLRLVETGRRKR